MAEIGYTIDGPVTISFRDCASLRNVREVVNPGVNRCSVGGENIVRIINILSRTNDILCCGCDLNPSGFRCVIEHGNK